MAISVPFKSYRKINNKEKISIIKYNVRVS